jgi:hypothetical protein
MFSMPSDQSNYPKPESESIIPSRGLVAKISEWNRTHPVAAILFASLLAVIINCYPIIFCGKSFVSPLSTSGALVYNWSPSVPGTKPTVTPEVMHSVHGSDTEAMMWWGVPVGFIESRSVLEHGSLPLWNRYGHAGDTLIGQALSMLGDPLQLIVIFGRGSAWAWDIKFLAAKFLFCFGFGLLVRRLMHSQTLALIFAALAAYCGTYFFINSHPVFFVLTYAPWILLSAIEWLDLESKQSFRWALIWLLANFACFNAGHIEVAVVLMGGLNLAAVICALVDNRNHLNTIKVVWRMVVVSVLLLGLTAPVWISFLAAMAGSYTAHAKVEVMQLPPTMLPGVFDDFFYLLYRADDSLTALAPGTSLLILVGCSLSATRWRQLNGNTFFWINAAAIVFWAGCIFRLIPNSVLALIPLLNRVGHTYVEFSFLLAIHLTIQSAYGFKSLINIDRFRQIRLDFVCLCLVFAGLFLLYSFGFWHQPMPWNYFFWTSLGAIGAPLLFVFLKSHQQQTFILGWVAIFTLGFLPNFRFGLYNFGNDKFRMRPGPRMVLNNPSQAVDKIKSDNSAPFRVVGLQWNFMGDYASVYELEDIRSCAPLSNEDYINLLRHFPGIELSKDWKIEIVNPSQAQPLLNLLNIKYLLTWPDVGIRTNLNFKIVDRSDFGVLENNETWPRAFFSDQVVVSSSNEEFTQQLLEHGRKPFIALTKDELSKQPDMRPVDSFDQTTIIPATNYLLLPNTTEFDIHAASAGVVCLTEGQAKDFIATANSQSKSVLTVNRAFKGIYLDKPGDYHIKFTYRPRHWSLACTLFWISSGAIVLWSLRNLNGSKAATRKVN